MDFKHSTKKAWDLLKKLGGSTPNTAITTSVKPNKTASRLISVSKVPVRSETSKKVKQKLRLIKRKLKLSVLSHTMKSVQPFPVSNPAKRAVQTVYSPNFISTWDRKQENGWLSFTHYATTNHGSQDCGRGLWSKRLSNQANRRIRPIVTDQLRSYALNTNCWKESSTIELQKSFILMSQTIKLASDHDIAVATKFCH